ncbi:MAG TPA: hypothetical protein DHW82_10640 [Spirochaetia bacterium]|nr:MAG: hypothetical protein A2Y41_10910 [Spirochaetes bacterium GWB1_36_13]HCL57450.1 hypothetical protein [Spirochaetia bacterium]
MERFCGYCGKFYRDEDNHSDSCRYHPQFYFPYDIDTEGDHKKGWQCCGNEDSKAPGCTFSRHRDDVRKVYRNNSIAYDYQIIIPEKEVKKPEG